MANKLPREKKLSILHDLIEGNTLRSTSHLTGVHRTTIMRPTAAMMAKVTDRLWNFEDLYDAAMAA